MAAKKRRSNAKSSKAAITTANGNRQFASPVSGAFSLSGSGVGAGVDSGAPSSCPPPANNASASA